ncbi:MAG: hypothetical protein IJO16_05565 [Clostridia bacterium]|nr:hypothetical protein [Clostridia bacterium]
MKKLIFMMLAALMLLTACSSEPKPEVQTDPLGNKYYLYRDKEGIAEKEKIELSDGFYNWAYYDESGTHIIKSERFNASDEQIGHTEYEFDADGNMIKDTSFLKDGTEGTRMEYAYENGNKTYQATYKSGVILREEYFDENEHKIMTKTYENGELTEWSEPFTDEETGVNGHFYYRPDNTLRLMQEFGYNENNEFVTTETEFDENEEVVKITASTTTKTGIKEEVLFER